MKENKNKICRRSPRLLLKGGDHIKLLNKKPNNRGIQERCSWNRPVENQ
jgi:hypothetical protein